MLRSTTLLLLITVLAGCSTLSQRSTTAPTANLRVEHGHPNRLIDGTGWVLGIPNKLALWDRRADNHDVSPATEIELVNYLEQSDLDSVLVRVNQYDPGGEWHRLTQNKQISPGWRYTVGAFNMLKYTLLPGRIFGGDWYNPYTDTINLYSDIPSLALSQAAYAKDVRQRQQPGTYAAVQEIPLVGMWHETNAKNEVLEYVKSSGTEQQQAETYRILYPNYGGNWGGQVASFLPYGNVFGRLVGAGVGHATNGIRTLTKREQPATSTPTQTY